MVQRRWGENATTKNGVMLEGKIIGGNLGLTGCVPLPFTIETIIVTMLKQSGLPLQPGGKTPPHLQRVMDDLKISATAPPVRRQHHRIPARRIMQP